ncbi:MAG: hypothetical protein IPJ01_10525 [Micavibrio sp.]|nr:hypothetical protein [Micavibrio sp.]
MEKNTEQGSKSSFILGDILNKKELSDIESFFKKNDMVGLKSYLNETELKNRLEEKGILADYLYYALQYQFSK